VLKLQNEIAEKVPEKSKKSPIKDELKVKVMKRKRQRISQPPQSKPQDTEDEILAIGLLEPKTEIQETKEPDESQPFFSKEELAIWDAEDHQSFYPDSVPCHKTADPDDERETCLDPKCDRKFLSYFSMMRHVAFAHYPARTAKAMKLKVLKNSQV